MRELAVNLYQNLGTGTLGTQMELTGHLVKLGDLSQSIDEDLTKISHGDLNLTVEDHDQSVWTFIQNGLASDLGFLPPFLTLDVAGVRMFTGIVNPSELRRNRGARTLEINAQDWSVMLMSQSLEGDLWLRPKPTINLNRPEASLSVAAPPKNAFQDNRSVAGPAYMYLLIMSQYVQVGDMVTFEESSWRPEGTFPSKLRDVKFRVIEITIVDSPFGPDDTFATSYKRLLLDGFNWPGISYSDYSGSMFNSAFFATIVRISSESSLSDQYYVATNLIPDNDNPVYAISLESVDALAVGDVLSLERNGKSSTWTVLSIDAELKQVITKEAISESLFTGDPLDLVDDSKQDLVFEDARTILARACLPYAIDLSRFKPACLPDPVMSWMPLRPTEGGDVRAVADMEPGLTDLRVIGSDSQAWDGTPESGWTPNAAPGSKRAGWTDQMVVPPTSLMPDETATLFVSIRRRNRAYHEFKYRNVDNGDGTWTPDGADTAPGCVVHDYVGMRRIVITGTALSIQTWNGSSWDAATSAVWGTAHAPQSATTMPGLPGALLAVTTAGTLELRHDTGVVQSLTLTPTQAQGVLVRTPWAAYLVSAQGYGRVDWAGDKNIGSPPVLHWADLTGYVSVWWPNTLVGLSDQEVFILGRYDTRETDGNELSETWAFRLRDYPRPDYPGSDAVVWAEKTTEGVPRLVGAFRDPSKIDRIIGHCGGRLFQVDRQLPYTLERFKAVGMEAGELIEHICQLHACVAIPMPTATLQIVSRQWTSVPSVISPDTVSTEEVRAWEHYYSVVRVSDVNDENYYDAGDMEGGKLLEFTRHPMVWTYSCAAAMAKASALWFGVPRQVRIQKWFHTNPDTAPSWEGLEGLAAVQITGESSLWVLTSIQHSISKGTATATMVELIRPGYAMSYGKGRE